MSLRTQVGGEGNRVRAIADVVDSARAQGGWGLASGRQMADWWLARWESALEVNEAGEQQLAITVTAPPDAGLQGAWLEVFVPGNVDDWTPSRSGQPLRHVRTEWRIRIPLTDLAPGEESVIELRRVGG